MNAEWVRLTIIGDCADGPDEPFTESMKFAIDVTSDETATKDLRQVSAWLRQTADEWDEELNL